MISIKSTEDQWFRQEPIRNWFRFVMQQIKSHPEIVDGDFADRNTVLNKTTGYPLTWFVIVNIKVGARPGDLGRGRN